MKKALCINCAKCQGIDKDGYIKCAEYSHKEAKEYGLNVFLQAYCSEYRSREGQKHEWIYSKAAYILDAAEVIFPMCKLVCSASIWTKEQLIQAVFQGEPLAWEGATKKGIRGLFKALYFAGIDEGTLRKVWAEKYAQ